jgi:hypothetical protein
MTASLYPVQPAEMASAGRTLAREFPQWEVGPVKGGAMWGALWKSADGRHRRYVVAPSAPQLLAALRDRPEPPSPS